MTTNKSKTTVKKRKLPSLTKERVHIGRRSKVGSKNVAYRESQVREEDAKKHVYLGGSKVLVSKKTRKVVMKGGLKKSAAKRAPVRKKRATPRKR